MAQERASLNHRLRFYRRLFRQGAFGYDAFYMLAKLHLTTLAFLCLTNLALPAEQLHKRSDAEGNVHYGTANNPDLCCMCQPAVGYETREGSTTFYLRQGLERTVGNERVFLSGDNEAWYCEGTREIGKSGKKCGLIPPSM